MTEPVALELVQDLMNSAGQVRVRANGTSMLPSIWPGDELEIHRICGAVCVGSVVAFLRDRRMFVHRVISVSPDQKTIVTRGDRLMVADPAVNAEHLLGIVAGVVRAGTTVSLPERLSWRARLLRAVSRVSDRPAFALIRLRQRVNSGSKFVGLFVNLFTHCM